MTEAEHSSLTPAPEASLRWVRCRLVAGHGVASGRATTSPYPAGTIHLQAPFFAARGIDLSPYFAGTLNLEAFRGHWSLSDPDERVEALAWTDRHPPETFSFWHCRLRVPIATATATAGEAVSGDRADVAAVASAEASRGSATALGDGVNRLNGTGEAAEGAAPSSSDPTGLPVLVYYPHPETKRAHHQAPGCLEVLAPWIAGLQPGMELELGVDPRRCRLIDPVRLRARLLEFLKFRVLAAQEEFFVAFLAPQLSDASRQDLNPGLEPATQAAAADGASALKMTVAITAEAPAEGDALAARPGATLFQPPAMAGLGPTAALDPARFRAWLQALWPEALDLDDTDLLATLEQAHRLYVN
jgi:hypothetical protein